MTVFLALFRDAWRRARDRKTVAVLLVVAFAFALLCTSLEFGHPAPIESLKQQLSECSLGERGASGGGGGPFASRVNRSLRHPLEVVARDPLPEDDLPLGLVNVAVAEVELSDPPDFDRLAREWRAAHASAAGTSRGNEVASSPLSARERGEFLEGMLRNHGWETAIIRPRDEEGAHFLVAAATENLAELDGTWKLSVLFRAWSFPMPFWTPAEFVVVVEVLIANSLVGFIGTVIFLAAFCGAVPDLLQKGSFDLVLARPVGRARVLLCTYFGAVITVLIVSATIFAACALALGVRSGFLSFAFVGCSLAATAVFAMLYPVALLFGLITRNANLALLASLAVWGLAKGLATFRLMSWFVHSESQLGKQLVDALYWIAPKTSEMVLLDVAILGKTQLSRAAYARLAGVMAQDAAAPDWWFIGGTSALFATLVLALAIAIFRRRDV